MAIVERHTTFQKTQETFSMDLYLRVLVVLFIDFSHVMTLRMVALNKYNLSKASNLFKIRGARGMLLFAVISYLIAL